MFDKFEYIRQECKLCNAKGHTYSDNRVFRGEVEDSLAKQCECIRKMANYARYDAANIPREYWDLTLESFKKTSVEKENLKERVQGITAGIRDYARQGRGLFLYGNKGTGKTMLSIEILKAAARAGYSVYYDFYPVVFSEYMKKGYGAEKAKARYEEIFATTDFIVLDELGKEAEYFDASASGEISKNFLEMNILKKRASKPTIIISNIQKGMEDIKELYGQFVHSVMSHNFDIIQFKDGDFREGGF